MTLTMKFLPAKKPSISKVEATGHWHLGHVQKSIPRDGYYLMTLHIRFDGIDLTKIYGMLTPPALPKIVTPT